MVSGDLQSVDGEQYPCPRCGAFQKKWIPDDIEADLVKKTNLCSYVQLKSKLEPTVGEKVFDDSRARWRGYSAANLATLHNIGAAKHFLDGIRKLTNDDTLLLRFYVPAFFTGITASLDCLAIEIHSLVCRGNPSIDSLRQVSFNRLEKKLECAAHSGDCSEADSIRQLRKCVVDSCDAKKLRDKAFEWRNAYAHRSVVFSGYFDGCAYLFNPNIEPCDIEKWVPPISECTRQYLLEKHGQRMLPSLEYHWQSARRIIDKSWSLMADIVDVRMKG